MCHIADSAKTRHTHVFSRKGWMGNKREKERREGGRLAPGDTGVNTDIHVCAAAEKKKRY